MNGIDNVSTTRTRLRSLWYPLVLFGAAALGAAGVAGADSKWSTRTGSSRLWRASSPSAATTRPAAGGSGSFAWVRYSSSEASTHSAAKRRRESSHNRARRRRPSARAARHPGGARRGRPRGLQLPAHDPLAHGREPLAPSAGAQGGGLRRDPQGVRRETAGTPSRASSKRYARSSTPTHGGGAVRSSAAQPTSASRARSSAAPPPRSPNNRFAKRRYRAISRLRASAATFNGVTVRNSS